MSDSQRNVNLKNVLQQLDEIRHVMNVMDFDFSPNNLYSSIYDEDDFVSPTDTPAKAQRFGQAQQALQQLYFAVSQANDTVYMLQNAIDSEYLQKTRTNG